jgi:hypothetical protein
LDKLAAAPLVIPDGTLRHHIRMVLTADVQGTLLTDLYMIDNSCLLLIVTAWVLCVKRRLYISPRLSHPSTALDARQLLFFRGFEATGSPIAREC